MNDMYERAIFNFFKIGYRVFLIIKISEPAEPVLEVKVIFFYKKKSEIKIKKIGTSPIIDPSQLSYPKESFRTLESHR